MLIKPSFFQVDAPSLNPRIEDLVRPSIDYMLNLQFPSGNCPSSYGSTTDKLIHWCHGAPGWIHMFALAYQVNGMIFFILAMSQYNGVEEYWRNIAFSQE